jgi:hypothetical protein
MCAQSADNHHRFKIMLPSGHGGIRTPCTLTRYLKLGLRGLIA